MERLRESDPMAVRTERGLWNARRSGRGAEMNVDVDVPEWSVMVKEESEGNLEEGEVTGR